MFPRIVVKKYQSLHDFNPYSGSLRFAFGIFIWFYSLWILFKEEMFSSSHVWYSFSDCNLSSFLKHYAFRWLSHVSNYLKCPSPSKYTSHIFFCFCYQVVKFESRGLKIRGPNSVDTIWEKNGKVETIGMGHILKYEA